MFGYFTSSQKSDSENSASIKAFANQSSLVAHGMAEKLSGAGISTDGTAELAQNWGIGGFDLVVGFGRGTC